MTQAAAPQVVTDPGGAIASILANLASALTIPAIVIGVLVIGYGILKPRRPGDPAASGPVFVGAFIAVAPIGFRLLMGLFDAPGRGTGGADPTASTAVPEISTPDASGGQHDGPLVGSTVITLAVIAGILVTVTITALIVAKAVSKARRTRSERRAAEEFTTARWTRAVAQHDSVLSEYGEIEMDAARSLLLPALFRSEPGSPGETFLDALERAGSLRTETAPPAAFLNDYVAAVGDLEAAWRTAIRHARKIGTSHLSPDTQRKIGRAVGLLNQAQATDNPFEQRVFLQAAQKLVSEIDATGELIVPGAAVQAIEAGVREQLPAGR